MLSRIRKSMEEKDQGFTLIELLVVMIIIGILAAIAIPVFLSQRAKARDTSTKADVSTVGKEIASYFVEPTGTLTVAQGAAGPGADVTVNNGSTPALAVIHVSNGTTLINTKNLTSDSTWCVAFKNDNGSQKYYSYSADQGLQPSTSAGCV